MKAPHPFAQKHRFVQKPVRKTELAMETTRDLPDDASWQEIEERIRFLAAIEKSRAEVRRGEIVPHEKVRNLLAEWTSK